MKVSLGDKIQFGIFMTGLVSAFACAFVFVFDSRYTKASDTQAMQVQVTTVATKVDDLHDKVNDLWMYIIPPDKQIKKGKGQ